MPPYMPQSVAKMVHKLYLANTRGWPHAAASPASNGLKWETADIKGNEVPAGDVARSGTAAIPVEPNTGVDTGIINRLPILSSCFES